MLIAYVESSSYGSHRVKKQRDMKHREKGIMGEGN